VRPHEPRRSAVHVPEHEPPFQEPLPRLPKSRPRPLALALPWLTVTRIRPVAPTLPAMVKAVAPALLSTPRVILIG
jgi:hypothetical protein